MRVVLTLNGRNPDEQALMRQLAGLAHKQTARPKSSFPFSLLEAPLRAGLQGMEKLVAGFVLAVERLVLG